MNSPKSVLALLAIGLVLTSRRIVRGCGSKPVATQDDSAGPHHHHSFFPDLRGRTDRDYRPVVTFTSYYSL